jgi:hypothetical protein
MSDLDIASLRRIEHLQRANHVLHSVIEDLHNELRSANERLEVFYEAMRASAPKVGGPTHWSVRSSGWPWTHAVGYTAEQAVDAVLAEIRRAFKEGQGP